MPIIEAKHVSKDFQIKVRENSGGKFLGHVFNRKTTIKRAVDDVSFSIEAGEVVGYVGPNGAGKSTTIKMLSGILYPTSGEILVRNQMPHANRKDNAMHIGVVFGQRSQLYWDLPFIDALELYRKMYHVEKTRFKQNVDYFIDMLDMQEFVNRPIRQLSLGQKMRAELTVALLHEPEILYLDEPTIGLDVVSKQRVRKFIKDINKEKNTTVILTTHDMDDIEQVCSRLILIDYGKKMYDGELTAFYDKFSDEIAIDFSYVGDWDPAYRIPQVTNMEYTGEGKGSVSFLKREHTAADIIRTLMDHYEIVDFRVREQNLESILAKVYQGGSSH